MWNSDFLSKVGRLLEFFQLNKKKFKKHLVFSPVLDVIPIIAIYWG